MKKRKRTAGAVLIGLFICFCLFGCGAVNTQKRVIRIADGQPACHPENIGLQAFKEYVEEKLDGRFEVEICPNESLGSIQEIIELVRIGEIEYAVSSTNSLEIFDDTYQIFSLPYLFYGKDGFRAVMENKEFMHKIYSLTNNAGFRAVTWYDVGTRNLYATRPIYTPEDLRGLRIRVQPSPTDMKVMNLMGATAVPMSYGDVYDAMQQGTVDGAENSELAFTIMGHGELARYYTYSRHQITPDLLVANLEFLESLSPEEQIVFEKAAEISTQVEIEAWNQQIEMAKKQAEEIGVIFIETDIEPFREKVMPIHMEILKNHRDLASIYDYIQYLQKAAKEHQPPQ